MAVKSIIDLEIDKDGNFGRFIANFDRYQKGLKDSPAEWAKVTAGIGRSRKEFESLVKEQVAAQAKTKLMVDVNREADRVQASMERSARGIAGAWAQVARNTSSVASNLGQATMYALRLTAAGGLFGGAIGGLLGAGSLFGIDRMAAGVAGQRRSALGLGLGYGAQASFGVNVGRFVDPDAFLSSVAGAKMDVSKRVGLISAGLSEKEMSGDTGSTAMALLKNLKRIADQTDPKFYEQVIQARQLGQFTSAEGLNRLHNTSRSEFDSVMRQTQAGASRFDLEAGTQRAWQEFTTQMARASTGIENTFVKGLVRLEPGLEKLSAGFERAVAAFMGSDTVKNLIDKLGTGLDTFAKYVGTEEFQNDVKSFAEGIGTIARVIGKTVKWFSDNTRFGEEGNTDWDKAQQSRVYQRQMDTQAGKSPFMESVKRIASNGETEKYIEEAAKKRGLDPQIALRVARSEGLASYYGDFDATGKPTSFGPYQLHYAGVGRNTAHGLGEEFTKHTGLDARDPKTVNQQIDFSLDYAKQYGWAPWHGWRGPSNAGGAGTGTKVIIENNTGGNNIVTTNQVAQ